MRPSRKRIILAKVEATPGEPVSPGATDVFWAEDIDFNVNIDKNERKPFKTNYSPVAAVAGKRYAEISFALELKNEGTAGTAPSFGRFLQACGMEESAQNSYVAYLPTSDRTKHKTLTIHYWLSGKKYILTGVKGSFKIDMKAGEIPKINFNLRGLLYDELDADEPSVSYTDVMPVAFMSSDVTFGSVHLDVAEFSLDIANKVVLAPAASSLYGVKVPEIVDREPKGEIKFLAQKKAEFNLFAAILGSKQDLTVPIGSEAGKRVTVKVKAQFEEYAYSDDDDILYNPIPFSAIGEAGDDEIEIRFE